MSIFFYNIGQVLGMAVVHSLWQGLVVWFMLRIIYTAAPGLSSVKRYNLAAMGMAGIAIWFVVTLFNEAANFNWVITSQQSAPANLAGIAHAGVMHGISPFEAPADRYYYVIKSYLPYIAVLYAAGLLINLVKLSYCQAKLYKIRKALLPAGDLQWLTDEFAQKLSIRRYVQVNFSALVDVPCMIGYLKPIILLPVSLAANLSIAETEAILLHELAHIKRNDQWVNLLQQIVNSLLFFNPFAQLISRLITAERENCCDDMVVQATQRPLIYARALLKLEENRQAGMQLALAATTKKHYLLTRIERIMNTKQKIGNMRHLVLAMIILVGSLGSIAWLNPEIKNGKIAVNAIKPARLIQQMFADTARKKAPKVKAAKVRSSKAKFKVTDDGEWDDMNFKFNDAQLEKLSADMEKQAKLMSKYYDSPAFKAMTEDMERKGKEMEAFYNSDQMKELNRKQEEYGKEFEKKWGNNDAMEKNGKQMGELGKKIEKYFSSKEFKDLDARLKAKYNIKGDYHDTRTESNYQKYQDDLHKSLPADIVDTTEKMKKLGEEMRSFYQSPDFTASRDRLRAMSDSMRTVYDNPQMKKQQEEMRALADKMRAYTASPELAAAKKAMKAAGDRMRAYTNSPEFKKKMAEYRKNMKNYNFNYNYNYDNDGQDTDKRDTTGKTETPAKP